VPAKLMRTMAAVASLLACACAGAQPHPDSCQEQIPRTLANAAAAAFPGYRTPLETDNAPDDIQTSQAHGGSACLGVAVGDFTGDGKKQYLLGLTAQTGSAGLAVIALPHRGGWHFQRIRSGSEAARVQQYVRVGEPGKYARAALTKGPPGPAEGPGLDCPHSVALVGAIDAAGLAYCFEQGQWLHVTVAR
jgi:hypothetical protein